MFGPEVISRDDRDGGYIGYADGREQRILNLPPSPDRWKERSRTYQGIADAMGDQWGARELPPVAQQLAFLP
jgi:hypothetical protein